MWSSTLCNNKKGSENNNFLGFSGVNSTGICRQIKMGKITIPLSMLIQNIRL